MVKVIAIKQINNTPPGGELEVTDAVALVLVRLGNARYAEEGETGTVAVPPEAPPRRRGRPPRAQGAIGVTTTQDFNKKTAE